MAKAEKVEKKTHHLNLKRKKKIFFKVLRKHPKKRRKF
jgi:hypothetical protein